MRPILISCEHSLLAGEAWFETKVCIRRENSCTQDMPHASIPARGARGSDGGVEGGLKKKTRITTKARCTHLWRWVVSRSAKWTSRHLGGSSWNRPQRPNPGHLRDCWGCLGRFLGRLGHRTTAIVSTRGVGKSLEFRPGAPGDFFQVDRNARE